MLAVWDLACVVMLLDELRPGSASREDSTLDYDQNPGRKNYLLAYRSVRASRDNYTQKSSPALYELDFL